jgi:hypothetical protein
MEITPEIQRLIDAAIARERAISNATDQAIGGDASKRMLARKLVAAQLQGLDVSHHGGYQFLMDASGSPQPLGGAIADLLSSSEIASLLGNGQPQGKTPQSTDALLMEAFAEMGGAPAPAQTGQLSDQGLLDAFGEI